MGKRVATQIVQTELISEKTKNSNTFRRLKKIRISNNIIRN